MEPSERFPRNAGSVGYRLIGEYGVGPIGFYVEGFGKAGVFSRTNIADINRHIALERVVVANCVTVEAAADAFAADNGGVYPAGRNDISRTGKTFQDYLPGGELLENPYTLQPTEPQWNAAAQLAGQTGYVAFDDDGDASTDRYEISGVGALESEMVYSSTSKSDPFIDNRTVDVYVQDNLAIIAQAVELHFEFTGEYPPDIPSLRAYLPGAKLLGNPVTREFTEPSDVVPTGPGSIGYRLMWEYGSHPVGFYAQGQGEVQFYDVTNVPDVARHLQLEAAVVLNCVTVADAVEAFAADNNGVYPTDAGETNGSGRTVVSYISGAHPLLNPYTGQASEPVWGVAASTPGQTGYVAIDSDTDGLNDMYEITGAGAYPGLIIYHIIEPRDW